MKPASKAVLERVDKLQKQGQMTTEQNKWWHNLNSPEELATRNVSPYSQQDFWHSPPRLSTTLSIPDGFPAPKPVREVVVWDRKHHKSKQPNEPAAQFSVKNIVRIFVPLLYTSLTIW